MTMAQVLLVAAGVVFVAVHGRLACDLVRTRETQRGALPAPLGIELAWTVLPLLLVLAALAVAVAGLGRTGAR